MSLLEEWLSENSFNVKLSYNKEDLTMNISAFDNEKEIGDDRDDH